jgi:hypothetical protein
MPDDMLQSLLDAVSVTAVTEPHSRTVTRKLADSCGLLPCYRSYRDIEGMSPRNQVEGLDSADADPETPKSSPSPQKTVTPVTRKQMADFRQFPELPTGNGSGNSGNNLPPEWVSGVAQIHNMPCPAKVSPERWRMFRADCSLFLSSWQATRAVQLGWTTLDLFGAHCRAPVHRVQASGLLWLLDSRLIAALTADAATIRCASGAVQTYRRSGPHIGQVPAWELPL